MMELACFLFGAIVALAGVKVGFYMISGSRQETAEKKALEPLAEDDKEEQRRSKEIDEGIQNLMTFSINGQNGFDVGGM